jgi:hypothetical protein
MTRHQGNNVGFAVSWMRTCSDNIMCEGDLVPFGMVYDILNGGEYCISDDNVPGFKTIVCTF